jgi:large subunit ribosomal protein L10
MPAQNKIKQVDELKDKLSKSSIVVTTGYEGLTAAQMDAFRKALRTQGIEYKVIKNTLVLRAAEEIGRQGFDSVLKGPTGIAFGYDDVTEVPKAINNFITSSRIPLVIHGGVMESSVLTSDEVIAIANLPSKEVLVSKLLGQMRAPISGLVITLNSILSSIAIVLQRRVEQINDN